MVTISYKKEHHLLFLKELGDTLIFSAIQDQLQNVYGMRHFSTKSGTWSMLKKYLRVFEDAMLSENISNRLKLDETRRIKVVGVRRAL